MNVIKCYLLNLGLEKLFANIAELYDFFICVLLFCKSCICMQSTVYTRQTKTALITSIMMLKKNVMTWTFSREASPPILWHQTKQNFKITLRYYKMIIMQCNHSQSFSDCIFINNNVTLNCLDHHNLWLQSMFSVRNICKPSCIQLCAQ